MHCRGFIAIAAAFCLAGTPAFAQAKLDTPALQGASNFRDVAGTAMAENTADGHELRPGVFYRSNALSTLTDADAATLRKLNIALVIDLRTPCEIHGGCAPGMPGSPDRPLVNATGPVPDININIFGGNALGPLKLDSAADADQMMIDSYKDFVTDPGDRAALHAALHELAMTNGPVIFHCSSGKDRTGWLAVILQTIARVPPSQIEEDYLASNRYTAPSVKALLARVPAAERPGLAEVMSVQPQFLNAAYSSVHVKYHDMETYIAQGLGLSPADEARLRAKLVESSPSTG